MTMPELEALVTAWLEFQRTPEGSPECERRRGVVFTFDDLCTNDPECAWSAIVEITQRESDNEILGVLAAGPLEDLLSRHGSDLIDRVESHAERDLKFRRVLAGTWKCLMTDEVWRRVQLASGREAAA
jgi:hypothetical protein